MHHNLHSIAAAALIAVADETHVAGGVVGLWKVAAGHRIVSAFDFLQRDKNWRGLLTGARVGIVGAPGIGSPRQRAGPKKRTARAYRASPLVFRGLLDAPDLPVFILVAVAGIEDVLRAAIFIDVGGREQMHRSHVGARRLAGEGAVQFVDALPAVQVQRLGDSRDLVSLVTDALERGHRAVAGGDLPR